PDGQLVAYGMARTDQESDKGEPSEEIFVKAVGDQTEGDSLDVRGTVGTCLGGWSPDGRSLVVNLLTDTSISHQIIDLHPRKTKSLELPEVKATKDAKGLLGHLITDWSRDGKWFLTMRFSGEKKKTYLCRVKCDGSEVRTIGEGFLGKFSPDGKKVLYVGDRRQNIFVVDAKAGKDQRVSKEANGKVVGHCWSPDGKKIAYIWQRTEQERETFLMVVDANGEHPTVVMSEKSNREFPSFASPSWR